MTPPAVIFRVRWCKQGGHYHLRVFSSPNPAGTFAKLGELVMDERDWNAFLDSVAWQNGRWQFRHEANDDETDTTDALRDRNL